MDGKTKKRFGLGLNYATEKIEQLFPTIRYSKISLD